MDARKKKPARKVKKTSAPRKTKKVKAKKPGPRKAKKAAGRLSATLVLPRRGLLANQTVAVVAADWDRGADPVIGYGWTGSCADRYNAPNCARASLTESGRTTTSFCDIPGDFEVVLCSVS